MHQTLTIGLQLDVNAKLEIMPRGELLIILTLLILALHPAVYISEEYRGPFISSQESLVALLQTRRAGIVSGCVIGIPLDVTRTDLADTAKQKSPCRVGICPRCMVLYE